MHGPALSLKRLQEELVYCVTVAFMTNMYQLPMKCRRNEYLYCTSITFIENMHQVVMRHHRGELVYCVTIAFMTNMHDVLRETWILPTENIRRIKKIRHAGFNERNPCKVWFDASNLVGNSLKTILVPGSASTRKTLENVESVQTLHRWNRTSGEYPAILNNLTSSSCVGVLIRQPLEFSGIFKLFSSLKQLDEIKENATRIMAN